MLTIKDLSKTYSNGVQALAGVSLDIAEGMFGLLGPNGAGKSTLMRTLATLQDADTGTAFLNDIDILNEKEQLRQVLGYLPQEFGTYPRISATRMLDHFAVLKGIIDRGERRELVDHLLNEVNLWDARKTAVSTYSGGMKQRFGIAQALIGDPQLVIVDEPTAGLDPEERRRFHNLLADIGSGTVVILSTHIVDDVSDLCSDMAIMGDGNILMKGRPDEVIMRLEGSIYSKIIERADLAEYESKYRVLFSTLVGGRTKIHVVSDANPGDGFEASAASLEDVYFSTLNDHKISIAA
ncbi:MAG TPA: multidrug ABC transporter ATP-binding protein [Gammaproteobacteria bacterium]|jgi:ABC-type multidrug transport system ATPase subunit|nr:ABC transporter ATP-binding protein [Gammaproteobacteria bacterium]MDP6732901.1 ABC transporter ATP-binding protein [Gammaproteobacteria bacterium]HAJ76126.1 multidrug ABC transporter ATP-binding protein [Gammaproteobacteria bacterium]|tara:strand:+ start:311 stop:1195 length:885 start_codon:yes stop_codon:yes gene_type:complete